jgi:hypothetical protein
VAPAGRAEAAKQTPTIQKALTTHSVDFQPSSPVAAGKPVTVSFGSCALGRQAVTMKRPRAAPHRRAHDPSATT